MAFKSLVSAVSGQRQEIKEALSSLAYFQTWDPDVIGECCRISSVAEFAPDEIIIGPDNGNSHTVYFILEGICKMVQHMYVKVKSGPSRKGSRFHMKGDIFQYKRYRFSDSKTLHSESKNEGFKSRLLNMEDFPTTKPDDSEGVVSRTANSPDEQLKESVEETEEEEVLMEVTGGTETAEKSESIKESNEGKEGNAENDVPEEQKLEFSEEQATEGPEVKYEPDNHLEGSEEGNMVNDTLEEEKLKFSEEESNGVADVKSEPDNHLNILDGGDLESNPPEEQKEFSEEQETKVPEMKNEPDHPVKVPEGENVEDNQPEEEKLEFSKEQPTEVPEVKYEPDHHLKVLEECKKRRNELISDRKKGVLPEKSKNVRSVFIQIGFLLKGACFGLEKIENFIMSSTKVKCLKIPQRFLLKHNPCNIWNRIRLFHSLYLPKDERIFENFRSDRLWTEGKKKLSEEIASRRNIHNYTLDSDVPYSLRLVDWR